MKITGKVSSVWKTTLKAIRLTTVGLSPGGIDEVRSINASEIAPKKSELKALTHNQLGILETAGNNLYTDTETQTETIDVDISSATRSKLRSSLPESGVRIP